MTDLLFGMNVSTAVGNDARPVADAKRAEELGYDFVSCNDHPGGSGPNHETWTLLTWIAANTTTIRVATRVLGVPLRPPPVLAKMTETLDRLSGGRVILGLGAGGNDTELRSYGAPAASPGQRVTGLGEAIGIIRGMWSQPGFTYEGTAYSATAAELEPKPEHPIPIWLGTFGPRALALTGRVADGWIPTRGYVSDEELARLHTCVIAAAAEAGRDPSEIACVLNLEIGLDGYGEQDEDTLTGSPEQVAEQLATLVEHGFTGFNVDAGGEAPDEQLDRFAMEVIPQVRAAAS
jgi:alkanesulfonate monooxygenase SsuD/methylene tetrahydromethanopterin reductase-like flavin-dependent oxidoreductase (luciferase family)